MVVNPGLKLNWNEQHWTEPQQQQAQVAVKEKVRTI
jgi:hypothetical protein